ncbi:hypothetical protein KI387_034632, partial [Taxus chinensis]
KTRKSASTAKKKFQICATISQIRKVHWWVNLLHAAGKLAEKLTRILICFKGTISA